MPLILTTCVVISTIFITLLLGNISDALIGIKRELEQINKQNKYR